MEPTKCPICTVRLKAKGDRLVCPECGYYYIPNRGSYAAASTEAYTASKDTYATSPKAYSAKKVAKPPVTPTITVQTTKAAKSNPAAAILIAVITFIGIMAIAVGIILSTVFSEVSSSVTDSEDVARSQIIKSQDDKEIFVRSLPESAYFQNVVSQIFGKDYTEVTPDELSSVAELQFYYDDDYNTCIYAIMSDGTYRNFYADENLSMDTKDLSCFPQVTALNLEAISYLSDGSLYGMEQLTSISSHMGLQKLANEVLYPEQLTDIGIYSAYDLQNLNDLTLFPNVISLSVDEWNLENIDGLSEATQIEHLSLIGCDRLDDFAPLYDMTNLKSLYIDSDSLKEIGFVEKMPHLSYLSIDASDKLLSIEPLYGCADTLQHLYLTDTWEVKDYSVIESMPNLIDLQLYLPYESSLPSLTHMESLNSLYLYGAHLEDEASLPNTLTSLTLEYCDCDSLDFLKKCNELEYLCIDSISGYYLDFTPITQLTNLQTFSLLDTTAYTDMACLLHIPNLCELYIENCDLGLKTNNIVYNEQLSVLFLDEVVLYNLTNADEQGWLQEYEPIQLDSYPELFANLPNLYALSLKGNNITNVDFLSIANLTALEYLNISDNYVTDLTPLTQFDNLYQIICTENPISNTGGLEHIMIQ